MGEPSVKRRSRGKRQFLLTGFDRKDKAEKLNLQMKINSLGGVWIDSDSFDPVVTHVVCKRPSRSEKFLGACAMGKWILTDEFIHSSYVHKKWLDEEPYEWNVSMKARVATHIDSCRLLPVPRLCRQNYSAQGLGPFVGWRVALACDKKREPVYKRILECGGAHVCSLSFPLSNAAISTSDLTHMFVEEKELGNVKDLTKQLKKMRDVGIACVEPIYLGDYLTSFPKPELEPRLLPKGYIPVNKRANRRSEPLGRICTITKKVESVDCDITTSQVSVDSNASGINLPRTRSNSQSSVSSCSSRSTRSSSFKAQTFVHPKVVSLKSSDESNSSLSSPNRSFIFETACDVKTEAKQQLSSKQHMSETSRSTPVKQTSITANSSPVKAEASPIMKRITRTRSNKKTLYTPDPSQGLLSSWVIKKEKVPVANSQISLASSQSSTALQDDDVKIIEPEDVPMIFSPVRTRSHRYLSKAKSESCVPPPNNEIQVVRVQDNILRLEQKHQLVQRSKNDQSPKESLLKYIPQEPDVRQSVDATKQVEDENEENIIRNTEIRVSGVISPIKTRSRSGLSQEENSYSHREPVLETMQAMLTKSSSEPVKQTIGCGNRTNNNATLGKLPRETSVSNSDSGSVTKARSLNSKPFTLETFKPSNKSSSEVSKSDASLVGSSSCSTVAARAKVCSPSIESPTSQPKTASQDNEAVELSKFISCKVLLSRVKDEINDDTTQQDTDFVEDHGIMSRTDGKILDSSVESSIGTNLSSNATIALMSDSSIEEVQHGNKSDIITEQKQSNTAGPAEITSSCVKCSPVIYQRVITSEDYLPETPPPVRETRNRAKQASTIQTTTCHTPQKPSSNTISEDPCRGIKRKSGELDLQQPVLKKQKFWAARHWIPTCHLNQSHDIREIPDETLSVPLSGAAASVLEIVMEDALWRPHKTLLSVRSVVSTSRYPSANVLSQLINEVLLGSEQQYQANRAYSVLSHMLELHPPTTPALQKVYLAALRDKSTDDTGQQWNFIRKIISGTLTYNDDDKQSQHNCYQLLKYIVAVTQKDFNYYHLRLQECQAKRGLPMIAQIIWPNGLRVMNNACQELIMSLVEVVQLEQQPHKMELVQLIQSLVAMTAHCLVGGSTVQKLLHLLPEQACLFARELAYRMNGDSEIKEMQMILKSLQLPWLTVKATQMILDLFDDRLLPLDLHHPSDKLNSLKSVLEHYIYLVPPTDVMSQVSPHKKTDSSQSQTLRVLIDTKQMRKLSFQEASPLACTSPSEPKRPRREKLHLAKPLEVLTNASLKRRMININKQNSKGETQLHLACMKNNVAKLHELLQTPGINVNMADYAGWTPLHEACNHGHLDCVLELLKYKPPRKITSYFKSDSEELKKVNLLVTNSDGISPLHDAVMNNHLEITRVLLHHGGERLLHLKTHTGATPRELVISDDMKQLLEQPISDSLHNQDISFSQESSCSQCSQGPSCVRRSRQLQVCEDKYTETVQPGAISQAGVTKYVILVYHLILSYVKFYDLLNQARAPHVKTDATSTCDLLSEDSEDTLQHLLEDIKTLKHLKNYVTNFENHLRHFVPDMNETPRLLILLNIMAECSHGV